MYSEDFLPLDNFTTNYTHIFFRWPQIVNADSYLFSIISDDDIYEIAVYQNSIIIDEFLEWSNNYRQFIIDNIICLPKLIY